MKLNFLFLSFALCVVLGLSSDLDAQQWTKEIIRSNLVGPWCRSGDFDNDNDQDLLIQNGDTLFWYENQKSGWSEHIIGSDFYNAEFCMVEIFDLDLDGDLDILQYPMINSSVIVWNENQLNGRQWKKHIIDTTVDQPQAIFKGYGDIDGDGDIDFVIPSFGNGSFMWFENVSGDTIWQKRVIAADIGSNPTWASLSDMDGDNDLDIIGSTDSGYVIWYENQLPNTNWSAHTVATLFGSVVGYSFDLDEDGDQDIITHSAASNVLIWFENPSWTRHTIAGHIPTVFLGPIGDIDQDGDPDITFGGQSNMGWCENLGEAINWKTYIIDTVNNLFPTPIDLADINGDGSLDLTVYTVNYSNAIGDSRWYANPYQPTGIMNISNGLLREFNLSQNYPNPFNPSTNIEYSIPVGTEYYFVQQNVQLKIYDVLGREVTTLVNQKQKPGNYEVTWDASNQPSGVYFYKLQTGDFTQTKKMILLR